MPLRRALTLTAAGLLSAVGTSCVIGLVSDGLSYVQTSGPLVMLIHVIVFCVVSLLLIYRDSRR